MKRALAFLFRLEGGRPLSEKEFVQFASYRLSWFKPTEAQRLLRIARDLELVEMRDGRLHPAFDVAALEVPMDFRPPASVLEAAPVAQDLFRAALDRVVERAGVEPRVAVAAINAVQERMDVAVEVAALVYARGLGVDITDLIDPVRDAVARRLG